MHPKTSIQQRANLTHQFCEDAYLNKTHSPWRKRRVENGRYGTFMIIDVQHKDW